jgi:hypothetical protein
MEKKLIVEWYAYRWDKDNGDIEYHAHGPEDSFVVFQGPYAKNDCFMFMKVMEGKFMTTHPQGEKR